MTALQMLVMGLAQHSPQVSHTEVNFYVIDIFPFHVSTMILTCGVACYRTYVHGNLQISTHFPDNIVT